MMTRLRQRDPICMPILDMPTLTKRTWSVEVRVGERVRRACNYVEGGIVIASTGSKIYRCPIGTVPASETVRAMLTEIAMADLD